MSDLTPPADATYPLTLYGPNGATVEVNSAEEAEAFLAQNQFWGYNLYTGQGPNGG